jgi:hypothetical protein
VARLTDVRIAMAQAVSPLLDGYSYAWMPDNLPVGPNGSACVVIDPGDTVIERITMDDVYQFRLRLRLTVGGASDQERQRRLDELITPGGPLSAWTALETEGAMIGVADGLIVERASAYGVPVTDTEGLRLLVAELECLIVVGGLV